MSALDDDPIMIQAYSELMISCQEEGCLESFAEALSQPASDPVEKWAEELSKKARLSGWATNDDGLVLCPVHSKEKTINEETL